jgi:hypothetical protein
MAIPKNRAVKGRDLGTIKSGRGLSSGDTIWALGMSITKWTALFRKNPELELKDPTLALLIRCLDENPKVTPILSMPTVGEMYELLSKYDPSMDQKRFSIFFGSEASAAYRWLKTSSSPSPTLQRLMYVLREALMSRPEADRPKFVQNWAKTVEEESIARKVKDIFSVGGWKNPSPESLKRAAERLAARKAEAQAKAAKRAAIREAKEKQKAEEKEAARAARRAEKAARDEAREQEAAKKRAKRAARKLKKDLAAARRLEAAKRAAAKKKPKVAKKIARKKVARSAPVAKKAATKAPRKTLAAKKPIKAAPSKKPRLVSKPKASSRAVAA